MELKAASFGQMTGSSGDSQLDSIWSSVPSSHLKPLSLPLLFPFSPVPFLSLAPAMHTRTRTRTQAHPWQCTVLPLSWRVQQSGSHPNSISSILSPRMSRKHQPPHTCLSRVAEGAPQAKADSFPGKFPEVRGRADYADHSKFNLLAYVIARARDGGPAREFRLAYYLFFI